MRRGELKLRTRLAVGLSLGLLALARTASAQIVGGDNTTSESLVTENVDSFSNVEQQVNEFSVQLIAQTSGGNAVFDQTFNVAYSDPTVQAAVLQAEGDLSSAGESSFNGPTLASSFDMLAGTAANTVTNMIGIDTIFQVKTWIGPGTILTGDLGVTSGYRYDGNNLVFMSLSGGNPQPLTIVPGGEDIDTLIFAIETNNITTTITSTYLTTQTYLITGLPVPEPATASLLGLGGLAVVWRAWRGRNSKKPGARQ